MGKKVKERVISEAGYLVRLDGNMYQYYIFTEPIRK
jgi:hypothetical protein